MRLLLDMMLHLAEVAETFMISQQINNNNVAAMMMSQNAVQEQLEVECHESRFQLAV